MAEPLAVAAVARGRHQVILPRRSRAPFSGQPPDRTCPCPWTWARDCSRLRLDAGARDAWVVNLLRADLYAVAFNSSLGSRK